MDLSVVIPVYNERENLEPLTRELYDVLPQITSAFEIILVDDGSTDGSTRLLKDLVRTHPEVKVIFFRRNAGQAAAIDAGFRNVRGRVIVTLDADLQNDPADIPAMLKILGDGFDLVSGWRKNRKDGFILRKIPSKIANWLIRRVTKTRVHDLGCTLKVYRREIVEDIKLYGEMHRFLVPIAEGVGAKTAEYVVNHRPRRAGVSKYGLGRSMKVILDLLTLWFLRSYQTKPIYVFGRVGALMYFVSTAISAWVLWEKYFHGVWVHRNPLFLIALLGFITGTQFLAMGLISELIIRTYFESQNKTSYFISEVAEGTPEEKRKVVELV